MTGRQTETGEGKPLRLWPGIAVAILLCVIRYVLPVVGPESVLSTALFGGMIGALLVIVWWLFLSRAPWTERLSALAALILVFFASRALLHESIATAAMGMLYPMLALPVLALALVLGVMAGRSFASRRRLAVIVLVLLVTGGAWTLVRTTGVSGGFDWDFAWRWSETAEERLLAGAGDESDVARAVTAISETAPEWPGFRGPGRDSVVRAARIETDWAASPPAELWRRPVGPGWSSFAVHGDLLYTQEQRGEEEAVSCYRLSTGEPVWRHGDPVRFWEAMAGAGPRSTPTLGGDGRVYALGATGILNALDAGSGSVVWSRDLANELDATLPGWGFAGSPLVIEDTVIAALAGQLAAYDRETGEPRWTGPAGRESYGSPHALTIDGVPQVLLLSGNALISLAPADGEVLWEHEWPGFHSLQPAVNGHGDLVIGNADSSGGVGTRRLAVSHGAAGWEIEERWTTRGLKPYFNDFVLHEGHAYGFDGRILSAIDLEDGERRWKGGRWGHGQLVLLPDQDLLLVLSEKGEIGLVAARPDGFEELTRVPAIEGKTWNHPVVVDDLLLVRNAEEMAAFRLPLASG